MTKLPLFNFCDTPEISSLPPYEGEGNLVSTTNSSSTGRLR